MKFWASSEIFRPAGPAEEVCRKSVGPYLNAMFEQSSLATFDCQLRYIPIIMPPEMAARYPARSRVRRREALYVCAPQLDFDVFVDGELTQQLTEYVAGIATSAPHLAKLGASKQQIAEFELILSQAVEQILVLRPDQTRH